MIAFRCASSSGRQAAGMAWAAVVVGGAAPIRTTTAASGNRWELTALSDRVDGWYGLRGRREDLVAERAHCSPLVRDGGTGNVPVEPADLDVAEQVVLLRHDFVQALDPHGLVAHARLRHTADRHLPALPDRQRGLPHAWPEGHRDRGVVGRREAARATVVTRNLLGGARRVEDAGDVAGAQQPSLAGAAEAGRGAGGRSVFSPPSGSTIRGSSRPPP